MERHVDEGPWLSKNSDSLLGRRHHRRLRTILNAVIDAGLTIERFVEPRGGRRALELAPI